MRRKPWRFVASIGIALIWLAVSAALAARWAWGLAGRLPGFYIVFVIAGIALLPGYLLCSMFLSNLLHFRLPPVAGSYRQPITVLICARNEEAGVYDAVRHVTEQGYEGELHILCVDNGSSDSTQADLAYVFGFLAGCALLLVGLDWLVGWMTLLILPAVLISSASVYAFQRRLKGIRIEKSLSGALYFLLLFRALEAFCALTGYAQAVLKRRLIWK